MRQYMDRVYYYNRKGQLKIAFNDDPYHMQGGTGEFKDHEWKFDTLFGKNRNFSRSKNPWPFTVVIKSANLADYDALCDIFDADVLANEEGYFLINGWRLNCLVTKAKHSFYNGLDRIISCEATAEDPTWIRTTVHSYNGVPGGGGAELDFGRDYTYTDGLLGRGYNYGYSAAESHYASIDLAGEGNGYEILIYGPATNPVIYLNNKPVKVNVSLDENQRLKIVSNGSTREIKILSPSGIETDAFVYRDKENTPFMTLGPHTDLTFGQIRFDLTTVERRSEQTWI